MRGRQTRVRESLAWYNVAAAGRPAIVQRSRAPLPRTALSCERLRERPTTKCEEAALGCVWRPGYTRATEVRQRIIIVLPRNGKIMTMSFITRVTGPRYHLAPARSVSRAIEPISYPTDAHGPGAGGATLFPTPHSREHTGHGAACPAEPSGLDGRAPRLHSLRSLYRTTT